MRVLLDTCVISELRKETGSADVRARIESMRARDLFISVITLGELAKGVARLPAGKKREVVGKWVVTLEQEYDKRILPVTTDTARIWGELTAAALDRGRTIGAADGLIAATAIQHGLRVMTRNVDDFAASGAMLIDPWDGARDAR